MIVNFLRKITLLGGVLLIWMLIGGRSPLASAAIEQVFLDLENTVSTYHQDDLDQFRVRNAVNGSDRGWAIERGAPGDDGTVDQQAVFPTLQPLVLPAGSSSISLTFFLEHLDEAVAFHNLGHFALLFTEDANPNLGSTFNAISIENVKGTDPSTTFAINGNVVLVGGANPVNDVYTIEASISPTGNSITGFRLEVFDSNGTSDAPADGLPGGGPGRAINGNIVLSRFIVVTHTPVCPSAVGTIADLKAEVDALNTSDKTKNVLDGSLDNVQGRLDVGDNRNARKQIEKFIGKVITRSNFKDTNRHSIILSEANNLICGATSVLLTIPLP